MEGNFIKPEQIFNATNDGLDIILDLYPDAYKSVDDPKRKFKIRSDEKSASASLYAPDKATKIKNTEWVVIDYGDDQKPRNGIQCWMLENRISWLDALKELAAKYGITGDSFTPVNYSADYTGRDANEDEPEGLWTFEIRDSFTDFEIETILSKNVLKFIGWYKGEEAKASAYTRVKSVFIKYRFWPVISYTLIKNRKAHTFAANDQYPIFLFDETTKDKKIDFKKVYQPRHADKGRRFMYYGAKPNDFIHGLAQAKAEMRKREEEALKDDDGYDDDDEDTKKQKRSAEKLPEFILASGGSDALNLAVLGYWVGWLNSETAKLQGWDFADMAKLAKKVYQCQDIDDTGRRMAHGHALEYLDLYTIELPEDLKQKKDSRGNPCKDLRDYLNHYNDYDLGLMIKDALPYRFWEMTPEFTGKGADRVRTGWKYEFHNVQAYNFLNKNGFYQLAVEGRKQDYLFVQTEGNVVREVTPNNVKKYMHNFLEERRMDHDLRNTLYRSTQLSENSLSNLKETEIDFNDYDSKTQYLFFKNVTWEITAAAIIEHKPDRIKRYVWEENIIEHRVKLLEESPFNITTGADGSFDIEVNHHKCHFFNYLIQTSRMHWKKELEVNLKECTDEGRDAYKLKHKYAIAGDNLKLEEIWEQKQHLMNKIFAIGHLMHRFKDRDKSWSVVGMDNKMSNGQSNGGSGKSMLYNQAILKILKKPFKIAGGNKSVTENPHIFHGLTKDNRAVIVDDADKYFNFRFFFEFINGDQVVNPKQNAPYTIPFDDLCKLIYITNFELPDEQSYARRILYTSFSDYFHMKDTDGEYQETRSPKTDSGITLFDQFSQDEWELFYNTMARCLQFYLSCPIKFDPPLDSITKRNLYLAMGEDFEGWASTYFSPMGDKRDRFLVKQEAYEDFMFNRAKGSYKITTFKKSLAAFCKYKGYYFNPSELINDDKRIMHRVRIAKKDKDGNWNVTDKKDTQELIYICSDKTGDLNRILPGEEKEPDMPF